MSFGTTRKEKELVSNQESTPNLPLDIESELPFHLVITQAINNLRADPRGYSVQELSNFLESHPGFSTWVLEKAMNLISNEIDDTHVDLIVSALLENRQVVVMGPHYSVADIAGFYKVLLKVRQNKKIKDVVEVLELMGPASSKFFQHKKTMFAKVLIEPLKRMGIDLYQVAQIQDKETREALTESEIQSINAKAWMKIIRGMKRGKILGIFPTGTREYGAGITRAPIEVCNAIAKRLKSNTLVVFVITEGSDVFLGRGMTRPDFAHLPKVITSYPITYGKMEQLAEAINEHISAEVVPLHPVEVANLLAVFDKPHRWGELSPFIELLMDPTEELLAELETILPAVTNTEYLMDLPNVNLGLLTNSLIDGLSIK